MVKMWLKLSERNQPICMHLKAFTDQFVAKMQTELTRLASQAAVGVGGSLPDVTTVQQEWWERFQAKWEADRDRFNAAAATTAQSGCGWMIGWIFALGGGIGLFIATRAGK